MRKVSDEDQSDIDAAGTLGDDETIVIANEKRITKERKPRVAAKPVILEMDDDDAIDADEIEGDDDAPDGEIFPAGSLGELLTQGEDERLRHTQCNVVVRRKPDSPGEKFAKPCIAGQLKEAPLRNIDLSTSREDIEEMVRTNYLGGHYYLQIQIGNAFHRGWECDLADPPDAAARLRSANTFGPSDPLPTPAAAATPTINPIDAFLDNLEKQKRMQELLFGDQRERYERELADLRAEVAAAKREPSEPKGERLIMLEQALATPNPDLQGRLLNHIFPSDEEGSRHWSADLLAVALENKETLLGLAGSLLGPLLGGPAIQPRQSVADMMRAQPPTPPAIPQPDPNRFRRPRFDTPPPVMSDAPTSEPGAIATGFPDEAAVSDSEISNLKFEIEPDDDGPTIPVEAFINQPEPLPLTSEGIDQSTDAAAIDAEEEVPFGLSVAVTTDAEKAIHRAAVKKTRGAAK